jgi:hypothetical protein
MARFDFAGKARNMDGMVQGKRVEVRLHPGLLAEIDEWRRYQRDLPPRAEAIVRLAEIGLEAERQPGPKSMVRHSIPPGEPKK